jgi:predicted glycoside hydrolase/deacetylase ChbG (UPF0249 family)
MPSAVAKAVIGSSYDNLDSHQCIFLIAMVMRVRNGLVTERTVLLRDHRERTSAEACSAMASGWRIQ